MTPPPLEPPPFGRSRGVFMAWIPIGLGALVLVGSAVWGGVLALRGDGETGGSVASIFRGPIGPTGASGPKLKAPVPPKPVEVSSGTPEPSQLGLSAPPSGPRVRPAESKALLPVTEGAPIWGTSNALATVAIFGDLECPYTRKTLSRVLELSERLHAAELRLVFYHRPLGEYPLSLQASRALAAAALREGPDVAFRALSEAAHSEQKPNLPELGRWFESAGVQREAASLAADVEAHARVDADLRLAAELDVRSTPTLFVNGRRIQGLKPLVLLERAIADEMRATRWVRAQGIPPEKAYALRVEKNLIGVDAGAPDRVCAPAENAPSEGPEEALVTLVEFSDFECAHCRQMEQDLRRIAGQYPGLVRRVWRSFALPQHPRSRRAAAFALAARESRDDRAFWKLHRAILAQESPLDDRLLRQLAEASGFSADALLSAASDPARASHLDADEALGRELHVEGTPTLFVNGRRVTGAVPSRVLDSVIQEELAAARRIVRAGTAAIELEGLLCATPSAG